LHEVVLKHMIHGPCRTLNPRSPCMKRFPKNFLEETQQGNDSYPQYKRHFDEPISINRNVTVDNR